MVVQFAILCLVPFFASLIIVDVEPTSYTQATKNSKWRAAMAEKFNALIKTRMWTLVPKNPSMNIVVLNGFFASNLKLMEALNATKLIWLQKVFINKNVLITLRHIALL
jgi:hypothetical protein